MKENNFFQFAISFGFLLLLFLLIHFIHFRFFRVDIILNAVLFDIFLSLVIYVILSILYKKIDIFCIFSSSIIFLLSSLLYAVLIPTMIDRSISVKILTSLYQEHELKLSKEQLIKSINFSNVIEKRFEEFEKIGLINYDIDNNIIITKKGKFIASIFIINGKFLKISYDN
jgi:hypothetical protein